MQILVDAKEDSIMWLSSKDRIRKAIAIEQKDDIFSDEAIFWNTEIPNAA